jgi:hypothetical protein
MATRSANARRARPCHPHRLQPCHRRQPRPPWKRRSSDRLRGRHGQVLPHSGRGKRRHRTPTGSKRARTQQPSEQQPQSPPHRKRRKQLHRPPQHWSRRALRPGRRLRSDPHQNQHPHQHQHRCAHRHQPSRQHRRRLPRRLSHRPATPPVSPIVSPEQAIPRSLPAPPHQLPRWRLAQLLPRHRPGPKHRACQRPGPGTCRAANALQGPRVARVRRQVRLAQRPIRWQPLCPRWTRRPTPVGMQPSAVPRPRRGAAGSPSTRHPFRPARP